MHDWTETEGKAMTTTCQICTQPLGEQEAVTCTNCANRARNTISEIEELYSELPDAIRTITGISYNPTGRGSNDTIVPGGAALVMLSAGTDDNVKSSRNGSRDHVQDQNNTDPPSVAGVLATIEDDWRSAHKDPVADYAPSVSRSANYLKSRVPWAARVHPAFYDAYRRLRQVRARMEIVTGNASPPEPSDAPCIQCHGRLVRRWSYRADDQGLTTERECESCLRIYTPEQYTLAIRAQLEEVKLMDDRLITAAEARTLFRLSEEQVYTWESRGKITSAGRNGAHRKVYRTADIRQLAARRTG